MGLSEIRVLVNDDANLGYYVPPPMRPEHVRHYVEGMYADKGIDVLTWDVCINGSLVYDTRAGAAMFTGRTDYGGLETAVLMANYRGLAESGKDIFRCVVDEAHRLRRPGDGLQHRRGVAPQDISLARNLSGIKCLHRWEL